MTTAEATISNEVKVEDLGATKKRLTITVPQETVDEKLGDSLAALISESTLPGFRKGRAPKALIERRFGTAVRQETKSQIIADAFAKAVEESELKTVGEPEPAEGCNLAELDVEPGKPLTFAVEVEVMPEFDMPKLEGIEIKRPTIEITEEMIAGELKRQAVRFGDVHEVETPFEAGDRLKCSAKVTKDGEDEPFFTTDEAYIGVPDADAEGKGQVLGLLIDDLESQLKGKAVGETFSIHTVGPDNHEREDLRGTKIAIELTIDGAFRVEPATPEHLVATFGLSSEEMLTEQVKLALETRRDQEIAEAMRSQVYEYLNDAIELELPEKLSESQASRMLEQTKLQMAHRGVPEMEIEQHLAEMRAESETRSNARLKMYFIMQKLGEHYEIEVADQEVNGRIAQIAMERGVRPEQLRNELSQSGQLGLITTQLREQKTADRIVGLADVTDVDVETWKKIVADKDETHTKSKAKAPTTKKKTTSKKKTTRKKSTTRKASD